jgi:membrane protease YdiL (CAAX protease family)
MTFPASQYLPPVRPAFGKTFLYLYLLGLFGAAMGLPYIFALIQDFLPRVSAPLPFPVPALLALQTVQLCVYVAIAVALGILTSRRIDNGAPLIESWLSHEPVAVKLRAMLLPSLLTGIVVGIVLLLLLVFVFIPLVPAIAKVFGPTIPIWKKFLASFYGGIVEELLMRFFLVSLLTWLGTKLLGNVNVAFWVASVIVAVIFGLGHLGSASLMMPITATVVIAALVLNGIAALAFSHLYWRFGLESAIIAHFTTDIVLHVIGSMLL